jgi:hypothetical protein
MDYILNSAYHMFPDSTAAKKGKKTVKKDGGGGEDSSPERYPEDEQATAQQIAFAYLMRGVHW